MASCTGGCNSRAQLSFNDELSCNQLGDTGHEQVDHASVVQMGGRIYDAHIGRFLQADPFVQSPSNSQNFNRYSYVLNNPLSYTDPSGYLFKALKKYWRVIAAAAVSFYTFNVVSNWAIKAFSEGVLAGAVAGGTAGFMGGAVATGSLKGALQGAFSGAVFGAIGAQFGDAKTHVQVGAHSMAGGVLGKLHGGNFGHGFFSAGFTKWAGKEWKVDTESARNVIGNSLKQAIIGGTASKITGNKFSNGAFTAALQYIVNEASSEIQSRAQATHVKGIRIDIGYTDAVGHGLHGQHHALVIITDPATGQQYAVRAGPSGGMGPSQSAGNSAASGSGGSVSATAGHGGSGGHGLGSIYAEYGIYNEYFRDAPSAVHRIQHVGYMNSSSVSYTHLTLPTKRIV